MALVAIPVVVYFLYDLSLLLMVILPAIRQNIGRIAFPGAENVYLGMVTLLSAWIAVLILIPAVVLLLRGVKLKWRYIVENPAMHRIFQRQVKWSIFSFLGGTGCCLMYFLSVFAFEHMIWAFMK